MGALTFALPPEPCAKAKKPKVEVRGGVDVTEFSNWKIAALPNTSQIKATVAVSYTHLTLPTIC
eukprot:9151692-Prorocentrum_lima.AAC.1